MLKIALSGCCGRMGHVINDIVSGRRKLKGSLSFESILSVPAFAWARVHGKPEEITAQGDGFVRRVITRQPWCARSYQIGITCNFKSGKAFRKKSVEAGASEDKGRM